MQTMQMFTTEDTKDRGFFFDSRLAPPYTLEWNLTMLPHGDY
jgi:hypothetical protein